MVGEININKSTRHFRITHLELDILITMMLEDMKNIKNVSELNEEDFYLLDTLIKCKLVLCNIELGEDYSENLDNLLKYCRDEKHVDNKTNVVSNYTYISLTNNNTDKLIQYLFDKIEKAKKMTETEETMIDRLLSVKSEFSKDIKDEELTKTIKEFDRIKSLIKQES